MPSWAISGLLPCPFASAKDPEEVEVSQVFISILSTQEITITILLKLEQEGEDVAGDGGFSQSLTPSAYCNCVKEKVVQLALRK